VGLTQVCEFGGDEPGHSRSAFGAAKDAIRHCTVCKAARVTQIGQDAPNLHIRPSYVQLSIISKELLMSVIWTRGR
jgi:hypothetical protein